jgi:hypothetical protein
MHGIQVRNRAGVVTLDTTNIAWNFAGSYPVSSGGVLSVTIPDIVGRTVQTVQAYTGVFDPLADHRACTITVDTLTGVVSASGSNISVAIVVLFQ